MSIKNISNKTIPMESKETKTSFLEALSDNTVFIKRMSVLAIVAFIGLWVVACLALIYPSMFGSFGEKAAYLLKDTIAIAQSDGNMKLLLVYVAVFSIDAYCLGYKKSAIKSILSPDGSTKIDICVFFMSFLRLWRYTVMLSFFMIGYYIQTNVFDKFDSSPITLVPSYLAQAIIYFVIYDFFGYWRHRFGHRVSWWWSVHRFHHSAEKFNIITVIRSHPLDLALTGLFVGLPMGLLGAPVEIFIGLELFKSAQGKLQHSMVDWDFGILGKYLLMSPIGHRVHHSPDPIHWDKNFGHFLVIWDRMFGTWYDGKEINTRIGLWGGEPVNQNGFTFDLVQAQLKSMSAFFSTKWKFNVGVLKPERVPILSAQYRESCKREGIEP